MASIAPYALDMAAVRAGGDELPGGKASEIRVEKPETFSFPGVASVGGDGWNSVALATFSYQLILATDSIVIVIVIVIDTGFVRGQDEESLNPTYDDDAIARMDAGLGEATEIVVTHEHPDHIGGLVAFYGQVPDIGRAIRLNPEQVTNVGRYHPNWASAFKDITPIAYDKYLAIAPAWC